MKKVLIFASVLVFLVCAVISANAQISIYDLNPSNVIGSLGKPLGTIVTIEGTVVGDDYTQLKEDSGETLLKIEKVDGKKLNKAVVLHVQIIPIVSVKIPQKGTKFKLAGYETGGFIGIPEGAFKYIPQATTCGFQFEVYFEVIKDLK